MPALTDKDRLTKADTVALWHAVDALFYQVKTLPELVFADGTKPTAEYIAQERDRLVAAKVALRKVNAIRKDSAAKGKQVAG